MLGRVHLRQKANTEFVLTHRRLDAGIVRQPLQVPSALFRIRQIRQRFYRVESVRAFLLDLFPITNLVRLDWFESARPHDSSTGCAHIIHFLDLRIGRTDEFYPRSRGEEVAEFSIGEGMLHEARLRNEEEGHSFDIGSNPFGTSCSQLSHRFVCNILEFEAIITILNLHRNATVVSVSGCSWRRRNSPM